MTKALTSYRSRRRALLAWLAAWCATPALGQGEARPSPTPRPFAPVVPGRRLQFPHDEGSHPDFRVEWWYVTGWLDESPQPLGFQVTFFRVRPDLRDDNPSRFAPRQILIAHAALSDPAHRRLIHDQRAARAGFGLAGAEEGRMRVWIDDWRLEQEANAYRTRIAARDFSLDLTFAPTQPPLLQGDAGFSRKGPAAESASYYYSLPQLRVAGTLTRDGQSRQVAGSAWLDHEWSSQYLQADAVGWDWIGLNLDDGGALMLFRMRGRQDPPIWASGTLRQADGREKAFASADVRFTPRREWKSPRTGAAYPVSLRIEAGDLRLDIDPLFDDQEHDTRASSGTIYWEGAVRALLDGKPVGRGYLELTGYWRRVNL